MKRRFKKHDLVSWKSGRKTLYGTILKIEGDSALISIRGSERWGEETTVPKSVLEYEPPVTLGTEDLRKFSRFEIRYAELKQGRTFADIDIPEPYQIVPEDLKAAVMNYHRYGIDEAAFADEYFWPLWDEIYNGVGIETALNGPDGEDRADWPVPNRYTVFSSAWEVFMQKFEYGNENADLDDVIAEVQTWEDNRDRAFSDREYTPAQKRVFLRHWDDDSLASAGEDIREAYRRILDSLCEEDDREALKTKAYACYGHGNAAYGQNWAESQKCLLRLMEIDPDPQTANTLGYMYYYGRCTDGVPEYDKAFYYFSIGAAGWYYESRYKLSDMFWHGYGVAKNPKAAASLIWELYDEQLRKIAAGQFTSDFADVALRAGNVWREGIACWPDPDNAFYYYLQAQYAIRMRMLAEDYYGDGKVAAGIDEAIAGILPQTSYSKKKSTVHFNSMCFLLQNGLRETRHIMEMKIGRISDTEARLAFRIVPHEDGEGQPKLFVTVPEAHFCGMLEKIRVKARIKMLGIPDGGDTVLFDSVAGSEFFLYGRRVAVIVADYVFTAPSNRGKKYSFVSVTFTPGGKKYDYLCDLPAKAGDRAVVGTAEGEAAVTIVSVFEKTEAELALPIKKYRKILRMAD